MFLMGLPKYTKKFNVWPPALGSNGRGSWNFVNHNMFKQHGGIPHNPYHGNLYRICPDPLGSEMIAEVAYEEATGRLMSEGVSHHRIPKLCQGHGPQAEEMYDPPYCAGVIAFQAYFTSICSKSFLEGVAPYVSW